MKRIFRWILIVALVIISIPIGLYFLVFWLPKAIYPKGIHYFSDNTIISIPKDYIGPASGGNPWWKVKKYSAFSAGTIPYKEIFYSVNPNHLPLDTNYYGFGFAFYSRLFQDKQLYPKRNGMPEGIGKTIDAIWGNRCQELQVQYDERIKLYRIQAKCPVDGQVVNDSFYRLFYYRNKPEFSQNPEYNYEFYCSESLGENQPRKGHGCTMLGEWKDVVYSIDFGGDLIPYYWEIKQGVIAMLERWESEARKIL